MTARAPHPFQHAPALLLFARQWFDRATAEDVVQDAFVKLLARRAPPANPKAWLFAAVRTTAIDHARSRARRTSRELRLSSGQPDWFEPRHDDLIDASAAQDALESLPPDQREVIVLRIWAQMTLAEIKDLTGESTSTLFSRYQAGLAAIRKQMETPCATTTPR